MRRAKLPALFMFSSPCEAVELTNVALMPVTPAASSGICDGVKKGTHGGLVVSRVAPLGKQFVAPLFAWSIRNDGTIASALIWLMSYAMNKCVPRRPM